MTPCSAWLLRVGMESRFVKAEVACARPSLDSSATKRTHLPAALALVRYELPSYSRPERHILLIRDDRPPPVLMDSPATAWAVLARGWPIRVRLRLPDGRYIKPAELEDCARGEWP